MIKQINFLKADLDTVSTAAMLTDCLDNLQIKRLENKASDSDLKDSSILCIECGGDGLCTLNNGHYIYSRFGFYCQKGNKVITSISWC